MSREVTDQPCEVHGMAAIEMGRNGDQVIGVNVIRRAWSSD